MTESLANHFLIAMPSLQDPNFSRTVTYICEHNDDGAMGIVINRPMDLTVNDVLDHMGIETGIGELSTAPVYQGGPVQVERGFVLHRPYQHWESSLEIAGDIGIATSRDILSAIAGGNGPDASLIALGYAGWAPGQLEHELGENAWLNGPADQSIIFHRPSEERWEAAAALLGVDLNLLSGDAGHA